MLAPGTAGAEEDTATASATALALPGTVTAFDVITCTLQVNYPHQSGHVVGNVNVTATWQCTAPVASLSIQVNLFLDGVNVAQGFNANYGSAYLMANAATACVPGQYQATASGTVTFPPGYVPPSGGGTVASPTVLITCA